MAIYVAVELSSEKVNFNINNKYNTLTYGTQALLNSQNIKGFIVDTLSCVVIDDLLVQQKFLQWQLDLATSLDIIVADLENDAITTFNDGDIYVDVMLRDTAKEDLVIGYVDSEELFQQYCLNVVNPTGKFIFEKSLGTLDELQDNLSDTLKPAFEAICIEQNIEFCEIIFKRLQDEVAKTIINSEGIFNRISIPLKVNGLFFNISLTKNGTKVNELH